jgi:hypothetical protein
MSKTMGTSPQPPDDREPGTREDGEAMPEAAIDPRPDGEQSSDFDDPLAGHPDRHPGPDSSRQRPLTDNKAGG